jgi:hypothetical protein
VTTFGRRAFRRPLASAEVDAYMALQAYATEVNPYVANDFYTAVDLVVRAILQDPEFLYRIEIGTPTADPAVFALNGYEIATRMSYFLLGSTPDDLLLGDAEAGSLGDAAGRRAAAERLMADPRARAQLHRFHSLWLGYRSLPHPADLVNAFSRETSALIDRVVLDEPRPYPELFTFASTYLDDALADHYGLARPAGGAGWVDYDGGSERAGILSHGSVLAAFSKFSDTSPTQRGIFVRTRLMCQEIQPPPPEVDVDQPPAEGTNLCKEERYAQHRSIASCAACHDQMDPIGVGLEHYDIAGKWRDYDNGRPECPISGQGEILGIGTFSGPAQLSQLLLDAGHIEACVVRQLFTYAVGRPPLADEAGQLESLSQSFAAGGLSFSGLILDFVADEDFAQRREPAS